LLGWPVLRSDELRRRVLDATGDGPLVAPPGEGAYGEEETARTYEALLAAARTELCLGRSVILDATFEDDRWRRAVLDLADDVSCELVVVETTAPVALASERAEARLDEGGDVSGAGGEVVRALATRHRPWDGAVAVDTSGADPALPVATVGDLLALGETQAA
ncbi:MAG TPA: AAA family ATPase, partial [Acidimicrobiales bacterium]|nr:AAA family ATPase [Acidimicrobiales bacterium]